MTGNELPGVKRSYLIRAGEGQRLTFGGELATVVARNEDTGGLLEVIFLSGGKGATFPLHRHKAAHESLYVLDGQLELWIDGKRALLSRNDYANIPAGVIHGYQNDSLEPVYFQVMIGRGKPETMGYADDDLFKRKDAHLKAV